MESTIATFEATLFLNTDETEPIVRHKEHVALLSVLAWQVLRLLRHEFVFANRTQAVIALHPLALESPAGRPNRRLRLALLELGYALERLTGLSFSVELDVYIISVSWNSNPSDGISVTYDD